MSDSTSNKHACNPSFEQLEPRLMLSGTATVDYLGHFDSSGTALYAHGDQVFKWGAISIEIDFDGDGGIEPMTFAGDNVLAGEYPFKVGGATGDAAEWFNINQYFNAYCIDLADNLDPYGQGLSGILYDVTPLEEVLVGGSGGGYVLDGVWVWNTPTRSLGEVSAGYLREFYARNWKESLTNAEAEAFGAGLWEIMYDVPNDVEGEPIYSFTSGYFQAWDFENGSLAAAYLNVLDGSGVTGDTVFALTSTQYQDVSFLIPGSGGSQILPDLLGRVYEDVNNNGVDDGEPGIGGVTVTLTGENDLGSVNVTAVTDVNGAYGFDLRPGTYTLTEGQPSGFLDGDESVGDFGGTFDNTQDSNVISNIVVEPDDPVSSGYNFGEIQPSSLSGLVWEDFHNDGVVGAGERPIEGVIVTLTGTDDRGGVSATTTTDSDGVYIFTNLRPGNYTITEGVVPAGYVDGLDVLGEVNGTTTGDADLIDPRLSAHNDVFSAIVIAEPGTDAINYNFGELGESVTVGHQSATIGFWQNKHGQALILELNGGSTSTQLGTWLAAKFPNMYGDLDGQSNTNVAEFYRQLFIYKKKQAAQDGLTGPAKMDAQVMAVALATYATNSTLAQQTATDYGFLVTESGLGDAIFNVGDSGEAFGVADDSVMTVMNLLLATNEMSEAGVLYDLTSDGRTDGAVGELDETLLRTLANEVYTAINEAGDIPT